MDTDYVMGECLAAYESKRFSINRYMNSIFELTPEFRTVLTALPLLEKQFPDLSFWQGDVNWETLRTKTDVVVIRIGQGTAVDRQFLRNWVEAKRLGFLRMVYLFYDDRVSPGAQADMVLNLLRDDPPELGVVCDWETTFGGSFSGLRNVVAFMQAVEREHDVLMYTGYYWFTEHSNLVLNSSQYEYLKTKPLWLAWYANDPAVVRVPVPWLEWDIWQYGTPAIGLEWGMQSRELDMNWWSGSASSFYEWADRVPSEPTQETIMKYKVVWPNGASRRLGPSTIFSSNPVSYAVNAVVDVVEDGIPDRVDPTNLNKRWVKFTDGLYGASNYPSQGAPMVRMVKIEETQPPVVDPSEPLHTIETFPDGSIKVDGVLFE